MYRYVCEKDGCVRKTDRARTQVQCLAEVGSVMLRDSCVMLDHMAALAPLRQSTMGSLQALVSTPLAVNLSRS